MADAAPAWRYLVFHRFDMLALGVLLAFVDRRFRERIGAFFAERGPFLTPFLLIVPFCLVALSYCELGKYPTSHLTGLALPVAGWCFGLLVLAAAHGLRCPPSTAGPTAPGCTSATAGYAIYLYHPPVLGAAWIIIHNLFPRYEGLGPNIRVGLVQLALVVPLTWAAVELVYRGVERPLTAVGRRLAARVRIIPADTSAEVIVLPMRRAA